MKQYLLAVVLAGVYVAYRIGMPSLPAPTPAPAAAPFAEVAKLAGQMKAEDRAALAQAYGILARSLAANVTEDPVFPDTAAVRRAHRACMLYVWQAVLQNRAGQVQGLGEALEGALAQRIGTDEVPLNPSLQADAAKAFADLAASLK